MSTNQNQHRRKVTKTFFCTESDGRKRVNNRASIKRKIRGLEQHVTTENDRTGSTLCPVSRICLAIDEAGVRLLWVRWLFGWSHFGK